MTDHPAPAVEPSTVPTASEVRARIESVVFNALAAVEHGMGVSAVVDALAAAGYLHVGPFRPDDTAVLRQMLAEAKAAAKPGTDTADAGESYEDFVKAAREEELAAAIANRDMYRDRLKDVNAAWVEQSKRLNEQQDMLQRLRANSDRICAWFWNNDPAALKDDGVTDAVLKKLDAQAAELAALRDETVEETQNAIAARILTLACGHGTAGGECNDEGADPLCTLRSNAYYIALRTPVDQFAPEVIAKEAMSDG